MKKGTESNERMASALYTKEDEEVMRGIMFLVLGGGFIPKSKIIEKFGDTATTKALAILHKSYRVLVESREPYEGQEVNGLKLAERKFSQPEIKKLPPALAFLPELFKQNANKYAEYKWISVQCRWTTPVLGALPRMTDTDPPDDILAFERNWTGKDIIIQRYGIRKMFSVALGLNDKSPYAADRFGFETITVIDPKITTDHIRGIVNDRGEGLGTIRSECLAAGTEFILRAKIPTTYLSPADFVSILKEAGILVGLSPGRSSGYGNFEVEGVL